MNIARLTARVMVFLHGYGYIGVHGCDHDFGDGFGDVQVVVVVRIFLYKWLCLC